ncbi:pyridoxamine 5'-phosphate oxidase family protein [Clostridiaceae bacterium HSG29]|nr:pyridoxamine 5'-phosphate oxidase family protein [Clostridiaceae bacterium HSG29]
MRRKEKKIHSLVNLEKIINEAQVLRVGMSVNDIPYIVPLNFGYKDNVFYFHCAKEGKKIDIIRKNNKVAFEMDIDNELVKNEVSCKFTVNYRSIIGTGIATIIDDKKEKIEGLNIIMKHYSNMDEFKYVDRAIDMIYVVKIEVIEMVGKQSPKEREM